MNPLNRLFAALSAFMVLLLPFCFYYWDAPVAQFLFNDPWGVQTAAKWVSELGEGLPYFLLAFGLIAVHRLSGCKVLRVWESRGLYLLSGLCASGAILRSLKPLIGRQRPYVSQGLEHWVFRPGSHHWEFHSLPSGHAQVAFTVAAVAWVLLPRWRAFFLGAAVVVTATRPLIAAHFLSDVVAGAWVGVLGVWLATLAWSRWGGRRWTELQP